MTALKNTKITMFICIIAIVSISYILFFYLHSNAENNIKTSLFEQQKQIQIYSTKALAQHIGSDLDSVIARLQGLANSELIQDKGLWSLNITMASLGDSFLDMNRIIPVKKLSILDESGKIIQDVPKTLANTDLSDTDWTKQTKRTLSPSFSNGFMDKEDGKLTLALTYPIINKETRKYEGLISALISVSQFFQKYENSNNINSQYFNMLDNQSVQLIHPIKSLVGKSFFGNYTQQIFGHNATLNNFIKRVMKGNPGFIITNFIDGKRLETGYPIFVLGKSVYYVFIITPTTTIYSHIDDILLQERIESYSLLAGITGAVVSLIVVLIKWNSILDNQIKKRTKELSISNKNLELTSKEVKKTNESLIKSNELLDEKNKQLSIKDKMQKEFINIAAHELKTPLQSILGYSELLEMEPEYSKECAASIIRHTLTLKRLSENILDVTRIESNSLQFDKQRFNLEGLLVLIIKDYQQQLEKDKKSKDVQIIFRNSEHDKKDVVVYADKDRITQVISNLLENAIKFTAQGKINITIDKENNNNDNDDGNTALDKDKVIVSISDTGSGIHQDVLPRLFSKFASKSFRGIGLGLFISKSIIDAHGCKIWAVNNPNDKGATFSFNLPVVKDN